MTSSISISQIQYVLALAKTGSFSEAAEQCFVTQSTLSTMIKRLENQIDLKIFERKSKPIALTPEGNMLIDQFKVIYHEHENLKELIQETKEEFHGTLKIGIIPTLAPFLLPLFLDSLITSYPNVNFSIDEITTSEITKRIKLRELDIGILSIPIDEKGIDQKRLFVEDFLVYDSRRKKSKAKKYKIKDIDINRLWLLEESHCLTTQIEKICHLSKLNKSNQNLVFKSGSILSLLELVNMNEGITLLPRLASKNKNLVNEKYLFPIESPSPAREIGTITHSNFTKKRLLNVLENEIMKAVPQNLKKSKKVEIIKPL